MQSEKESLQALLTGAVAAVGFEMLGFEYRPQTRGALLRIYIDSEKGVFIDDCAKASRQISAVLEVDEALSGNYTVEVSSPGVDRPLFTLEHYIRFIGQTVKVHLYQPREQRSHFKGYLLEVDENGIVLDVDGESVRFSLDEINKANLIAEI